MPLDVRIGLRTRDPGRAPRAEVREIDGRPVVWVDVDAEVRRGALSSDCVVDDRHAAEHGTEQGLPAHRHRCGSSGADIVEGIRALHGWGLAAKALSTAPASSR